MDFFSHNDCMTNRLLAPKEPDLYQNCQFRDTEKHGKHLIISVQKIWKLFDHWQSESGDRAKSSSRKFIADLKQMNSNDKRIPKLVSRYKTQPGMKNNQVAVWISRTVLEDAIKRKLNIRDFEYEDFFINKGNWSRLQQNCFC